nr:neuromedin-B isoform X1 [Macaca nemestrina]XP_024643396.1 neuromedin-B isoform X1 [Macaca nemestrina]
MARRVGGARLLSSLLLFALLAADVAPLSWDLPEPRNRAGKIRVHPRGNLWATGPQVAEFLPDPGPSHPPSSCVILSTCSGKAEGAGFATTQTPLWLLGHFMGKKSLEPPSPSPLGTAPHTSLRDQRLQLSHDLLRILLLKKALGVSLSHPAPHI